MCGIWGKDCTPERWLAFMGNVDMLSPFQINYIFSDEQLDGMTPHSNKVMPCNAPAPVINGTSVFISEEGCSCIDCELVMSNSLKLATRCRSETVRIQKF